MTTESKKVALESLKYAFEKTYLASDVLDGKLLNILTYLSIIVSIGSTVLASTLIDRVGLVFWILLSVVLLLFLFTFAVIIYGIKPRSFSLPVSTNFETIKKQYYDATEEQAIEQAIVDHVYYRNLIADKNNTPKTRALNLSFFLLGATVVLLLIAVPLGLMFPSPTLVEFLKTLKCR
jgi:ABC-type transport system involved in multi-copper enzyme maturation permease subunit